MFFQKRVESHNAATLSVKNSIKAFVAWSVCAVFAEVVIWKLFKNMNFTLLRLF